jgi:hypothetical protein
MSAPLNVRAFAQANITAWRSKGIGTVGASLSVTLQRSVDLENWFDIGSAMTPAASSEQVSDFTFEYEWIRVKVTVTGAVAGVTGWVVGDFVERSAA